MVQYGGVSILHAVHLRERRSQRARRAGLLERQLLTRQKHGVARVIKSANLQIRTELFNFFNHPNFDLPDNFLGSPSFGSIRSAQSPRRMPFGVKLLF
jgi:hypothetical protein